MQDTCKKLAALSLRLAILACLALSLATPLFAQSYTATLEGLVTDRSGAVMPGAKVTLTSEATRVIQSVKSDQFGHYFFTMLPPASYKLSVESQGFETFARSGIILEVQQAARIDVQLVPGAVTTKIEVTGQAPRLDNVNASEGRVVNNEAILDFPIASGNGRDPTALAQLAPTIVPPGGYENGGGVNFSGNGGRLSITDILLDGVSTSVMQENSGIQGSQYHPTVELVQEFKIQTNSYSAEYGNSGGVVINMVTRSGGNQLHGNLFEFHQENALDANNFFSNMNGGSVGHYVHNEFGGTVGGPVYIPKLYDGRNKTFFFVQHDHLKVPGSPNQLYNTLPTAMEKQGNFSQSFNNDGTPVTVYDPATVCGEDGNPACAVDSNGNPIYVRQAFPGDIVPTNRWSSVAKALMPFFPDPTGSGTGPAHTNNYYAQGDGTNDWYEQTIKIDHNFTEKQRLMARYSLNYSISQGPNLWGSCPSSVASIPYCGNGAGNFMFPDGNNTYSSDRHQSAVVDYTNTLSPTTVLSLRWGVQRENNPYGITGETGGPIDTSLLGFQTTSSLMIQRAPSFGIEGYEQGINPALGPSVWTGWVSASSINDFVGSVTKVTGRTRSRWAPTFASSCSTTRNPTSIR